MRDEGKDSPLTTADAFWRTQSVRLTACGETRCVAVYRTSFKVDTYLLFR